MSDGPRYLFDHVHIYCSNLATTERWFVDVMGAEVIDRRGSGNHPTVALRLGGGSLLLRGRLEGEELAAAGPPRFGVDHLGLLVSDVGSVITELRRRGAEVSSEPRELRAGVYMAFVRGPDQVRIELVQRPPSSAAQPVRGQ